MSYISLSSFSRSHAPPRKSRDNFRNSRIVHKLRAGLTLQNMDDPALVLRTEPNEPKVDPKSLMDRVRAHFEDEVRSEKSAKSLVSQKSVKSSIVGINNPLLRHLSMSDSANLSQRSFLIGEREEEMLHQLSLVELDKRLDTLLDAKMRALLENNQQRLATKRVSEFERVKLENRVRRLDESLSRILQAIKNRKEIQMSTESSGFEMWRQLEAKIRLLQKILAENMTQLDMMKQYFAVFSHRNTSYKAMCNPVARMGRGSSHNSLLCSPVKQDSMAGSRPLVSKFPITTVNQASFVQPDKEDYEKFRFKHAPYQKNDRVLPHSNYQQSYQKYPPLRQHSQNLTGDSINKLGPSRFIDGSSYRKEFIGRAAKPYDYRQLDCFRDKFQYYDLKIRYFAKSKDAANPQDRSQLASLDKMANRVTKIERLQTEPCLPIQSTNRLVHQRISLVDQRIFKQRPRNERLQRFAHNYRMQVGA